ncbi:MAG: D-glycero-beta-D-manno-heptose 1-phosphate adenylyltransferase [Sedimentisphaerales bacterium]|nr:D-glycero-beta-D-manno-heptose 1-phosphate adenylyltransferase [Sedimentisphaerales bacterium]
MYENLLKTVTNLGSPNVLIVGDFMLDVYIFGDAVKISQEAPVPVLKVTKNEYRCGGAGSVAADIAALGGKPNCLGVIGDDQNSEILKRKLFEIGADISGLITISDHPTISKQRLIGLAQHLHRQQIIRMDYESNEPLTNEQYQEILRIYHDKLASADIVCLQDYDKGLLSPSVCKEMIQSARKAKKMVLVDPSLINDYSKYIGATVITPNRQETSLAVGYEITDKETAARAAEELVNKLELEAIVITLDKEGAYLRTENSSQIIPTRSRSVYDVTGAGDMVLATLSISLAAGFDYKTSVQLSNVTAGIAVEQFGTVTVTIEQVADEIVRQGKSGKVRSIDLLLDELTWHRRSNNVIVFTNGCFDVLHRGHIEYLEFCKAQGDIVVVGLNSDKSVKMIKGPERPINNQRDRAAILSALEVVDFITVFDEQDPLNLIKKIKPDILVKGEDWAEKGVVGREFVESHGGKVLLAPLVKGKSSTITIEKMKSLEIES